MCACACARVDEGKQEEPNEADCAVHALTLFLPSSSCVTRPLALKAQSAHGVFDIAELAVKLARPDGVHDVLTEVHALCDAQQPGAVAGAAASAASAAAVAALEQLRQLHHCLGRNLPVLKAPPMDMRSTLIQLASQEPAGSRLLRAAETALQSLQQEVIEWLNKPSTALPGVMEFREHSGAVYSVAVSPDGKWMASGSGDRTVKVTELDSGRVKWTLRGHRYAPSLSKECFLSCG